MAEKGCGCIEEEHYGPSRGVNNSECRYPALAAEVERLRGSLQRMMDLVRYKRSELHTDGLITDDEYSELLSSSRTDDDTVDRLEGYDKMRAALAAAHRRIERLEGALRWAADNLGVRIEWGGPFDDEHPQGVYHCTYCDERWKPTGVGIELHKADCGLVAMRQAIAAKGGNGD